jgi:nucleoside-diphosphate-sugar epimerase
LWRIGVRLEKLRFVVTHEAVGFLTREARFSIEKARRELGYQPRFSLEEGMKLTEQWLREAGYLPRVYKIGYPP